MAELFSQKIAMLLSQFPETHETFILREFMGLKEAGAEFGIFSFKKCRDKIIHPQAELFISQTHYAKPFCFGALIYYLLRHPIRFCKALATVIRFNVPHPIQLIKSLVVFMRSCYFAKLMKTQGITRIHAHWATMPTTGADVISQLTGIPFSFTAHAWDIYLNTKRNLKDKARKAQLVLTCTKANKIFLDSLLEDTIISQKIVVNYHGLDVEDFALRDQSKRDGNTIFAVGRLVEQKGFKYLIKACYLLKEKGVKFKCIIIGNGPLRKEFEYDRNRFGLDGIIDIPGTVTQVEIKNFFHKAGVFVMPSVIAKNGDRDGIPNVLLEALALGVPIVATNVSGIPEVIIDKETGRSVPPRNARALAEAMEAILTGKDEVNYFIHNGRKKIEEEFTLSNNVAEMVRLFK